MEGRYERLGLLGLPSVRFSPVEKTGITLSWKSIRFGLRSLCDDCGPPNYWKN